MTTLVCVLGIVAAFLWLAPGAAPPPLVPEVVEGPPSPRAPAAPVADAGAVPTGAPAAPAVAPSLASRLGASLSGRVFDPHGRAEAGVEVVLADAEGGVLDRATSDGEGRFALHDRELSAAAVVAVGAYGRDWPRALAPLAPGERRDFDLHLGFVREVVGWVLDMRGDPVAGASIVLTSEASDSRWSTLTDHGGAFRFRDAPDTPLRVDAVEASVGQASARLASTAERRREVTLTLEPVGWIEVRVDPVAAGEEPGAGEVLVVGWDPRLHGDEPPGDDPIFPGYELFEDEVELEEEQRVMFEAIEAELGGFDPTAPRASVERLVHATIEAFFRARAPNIGDHRTYLDAWRDEMREAAAEIAREIVADEHIMREIRQVAQLVQLGTPLLNAIFALRDQTSAAEADAAPGTAGRAAVGHRGAVVARGVVNAAIPVRGGFPYMVYVDGPDAPAQGFCGETFVAAGESITLRCGPDPGAARVEGRVVDHAGRPLSGLTVAFGGDRTPVTTTTTDLDGRFSAAVELASGAALGHLDVWDPAGELRAVSRRNIALRAGGEVLLETVAMRTAHEVAAARGSGGVGVGLELDAIGARVVEVPLDAPGALAGLEPSDAIVRLDGAHLGHLAMDEIQTLLRGDPGTSVELRVRTPAGELYDVTVDRAPCDAVASGCIEGGETSPW